ncbi:MAG: multiple sugar transport system substrate-binding protein [Thermotogota bacterium]|nr:multiple sugar transport system substrate-binding protein [Thermotogota bacterium]
MRKITLVFLLIITLSGFSFAERVLQIWAMGEEAKNLNVMVEKFMRENPGVKVEVQAIPWSAAYDKLLTGIAGMQLPDLAQMGTTWMAPFGAMGVFEELSDYIKNSFVNKDLFFEGSWQTVEMNGGIYGIPWYVDVRVMFYRTDILKDVGYDHAPQTWEELYDAAKKLAARGENMYALSLLYTGVFGNEFMPFAWQAGGKIFDEKGKVRVTDPEFVEAIEYYARFFWEELAPIGGGNLFQDFASGAVPIFFSGPWMVSMIDQQTPEIKGKWSVALMPKKQTRTSFVGGCNWVIFNTSKNKDLAWKFIEFMTKPENQLEWYKTVSSLPAVKSVWEYPELSNNPVMKVFGEQLKDAKSPPNIPEWEEIANAISRRVEEVIYKRKTPQKAAEDLEKDIEKIVR